MYLHISDPGTGSFLAQLIAGSILVLGAAIRIFWSRIKHMTNSTEHNMLPLMLDLTNPSAAIGWASDERMSFTQRSKFDCILALAFYHHLAISTMFHLKALPHIFQN
jgi:hypothetical protein